MAATLAKFSSHARVHCTLIHLAESVAHVAAPGEIVETGALDGGFDLKGGDSQWGEEKKFHVVMLTIEMKIGFYRTRGMSFHVSVYIRPFERDNYSVVYVMCQKYEAQVAKSNYNRFTGEDVTLPYTAK